MSVRRSLVVALALTALVAALEVAGGIASHSLALVSDAIHVCMDVFALALALAAAIGAARPADARRTYGYGRIEVLGALINGTLLLVATVAIVYEALRRFSSPVEPEAALMTAVAAAGLVVNAAVGFMLHRQGRENLNVQAALFHVMGDALGAAAVVVGGIAIALTHAARIDPLLSLFVAAIIVAGVLRVIRDAANVLLESTPGDVDIADVERRMCGVAGVAGVHDLHVWSIGSGSHALSAHVLLDDRKLSEATDVLRGIDACLRTHFDIAHVTIQFECDNCPVAVRH
ncbi:MAG TPA: cation diffusion facilitator family transporter [Candidatus Acidoferrales bacterium]|nr:cation diffusion facilitator family transporter [Candidatus Acidoferrales bacterium]